MSLGPVADDLLEAEPLVEGIGSEVDGQHVSLDGWPRSAASRSSR